MCQDSNSRPLEHESPTITTRPGLSPWFKCLAITTLFILAPYKQFNKRKLYFRLLQEQMSMPILM